MTRALRRALEAIALLVCLAAPGVCLGGVEEVEVVLPVPERISTEGMNRLLVGGFRTSDHPTVDLDRELSAVLRDLLARRTRFEVLDVEPLPLPEQPIEEAVRNDGYWRRLGKRFNADLIVGGTLDFEARDQSGFLEQDVISEITGQRLRQTVWVERESFHMKLGLYFFRGSAGDLIYEDHFTEETIFGGKSNDDLSVLHMLFERLGENILGILTPRARIETRYLLTE